MATQPQRHTDDLSAQYNETMSYQGPSVVNDMEQAGYPIEKKMQANYQYHESDVHSMSDPMKNTARENYQPVPTSSSPQLWTLRRKDLLYKQLIRILKFLSRFLSLLLALSNTVIQSLVLHKFLVTRNIIINGRDAWATQTTVWTTILLLGVSAITAVVSGVTVGAYFCGGGVRGANGVNNTAGLGMSVLSWSAHALVWVVTAAAYRAGKTGEDLWGWTCSPKAQGIQGEFDEVIDFDQYCGIQSTSWGISIAQAILTIATLVGYILAWKRMQIKKMTDPAATLEPVRV